MCPLHYGGKGMDLTDSAKGLPGVETLTGEEDKCSDRVLPRQRPDGNSRTEEGRRSLVSTTRLYWKN